MYAHVHTHTHTHTYYEGICMYAHVDARVSASLENIGLFCRALLQKRPIVLSSNWKRVLHTLNQYQKEASNQSEKKIASNQFQNTLTPTLTDKLENIFSDIDSRPIFFDFLSRSFF